MGGGFIDSERNVLLYLHRIGHEGERGKLQGGRPFHQVACTWGYFNEEILFLACASLNIALLPEPITIALAPVFPSLSPEPIYQQREVEAKYPVLYTEEESICCKN